MRQLVRLYGYIAEDRGEAQRLHPFDRADVDPRARSGNHGRGVIPAAR